LEADDVENKKNPAWRMRLGLVACALTITGIMGAMTPDPVPSGQSNIILVGFALSLMFSFVTLIAMIPAPRDPRRRRRREAPQPGSQSPDQVTARYANPSPYQPMLKESKPLACPRNGHLSGRDDLRDTGR
jgi:hypothetical protein